MKMERLQKECATNAAHSARKPKVVISGGGPGGLMRAILALLNGNSVQVIEKRAKAAEGRPNPSLVAKETIEIMKEYGIYQYLDEHRLFGPSPIPKHFPHAVGIENIERALKAIIERLAPGKEIIIYQAELERVVKRNGTIDLLLRVETAKERTLSNVDLLVVAEGTKSKTADLLGCRKVEVLSEVPIIGGIFCEAKTESVGFSFNIPEYAAGIVLHTPGYSSLGCTALQKTSRAVQMAARGSQKDETALLARLAKRVFASKEAVHAKETTPSFDNPRLIASSTMASGFRLPFCGKLSQRSIFMLAGDTQSYVDVISGRGANTALQSAKELLPALQGDQRLEEYREQGVKRITNLMKDCQDLRERAKIPWDNKKYAFACDQLKHRAIVEKVQGVIGTTLATLLFESPQTERLVRAVQWYTMRAKTELGALKNRVRRFFLCGKA